MLLTLPAIIRPGNKGNKSTNALAYIALASMTKKKSLITFVISSGDHGAMTRQEQTLEFVSVETSKANSAGGGSI